jgi:uncharacterized protein YrzB (UPF0473 family)
MDNTELITLYDEAGNPETYELIDIFELNGNVYGGFAPELNSENANDDEVEIVMLKVLEKEDGEEVFTEIEDPAEEEAAFKELVRREDIPY